MIRLTPSTSNTFVSVAAAGISTFLIAATAYGVVRSVVGNTGQHVRQIGSGPAYEARRRAVREAVRLQKEGYEAWRRKDDLPKAEALFKQALALVPEDPRRLSALAQVLEAQGKNVEAREAYRKVVRPRQGAGSTLQTDPAVLLRYAALCKLSGKTDEAAFAYQQIVNNAPSRRIDSIGDSYPSITDAVAKNDITLPPDAEAAAHAVAGIRLVKQAQNERAVKEFDRAAALQPDLALAHFYRGYALQNSGKAEEARRAFEKASKAGRGTVRSKALKALGRYESSADR